jgi:hypothetical protein
VKDAPRHIRRQADEIKWRALLGVPFYKQESAIVRVVSEYLEWSIKQLLDTDDGEYDESQNKECE